MDGTSTPRQSVSEIDSTKFVELFILFNFSIIYI
jgi:hypothetical protein